MANTETELLKKAGLLENWKEIEGKKFRFDCRDKDQNGIMVSGILGSAKHIDVQLDIIIWGVKKPKKIDQAEVGDLLYLHDQWMLLRYNAGVLYGKLSLCD